MLDLFLEFTETCLCSVNAVHPAWNCPTCNGKGYILKQSIREHLDNTFKDVGYIPYIKGKINMPDQ